MTRNALIVGASRGIGFGLAEAYLDAGWNVYATKRAGSDSRHLDTLAARAGGRLAILDADIARPKDIEALRTVVPDRLDLLLVNAGTGGNLDGAPQLEDLIVTNAVGPIRVLDALIDRVAEGGVTAVMTSILGSVTANTTGNLDAYRASKAALNSLTRSFAARQPLDRFALLSLHPGWVRTDMGGPNAPVSVEESVAGLVAVIAAARPGTHRFLDYLGQEIAW